MAQELHATFDINATFSKKVSLPPQHRWRVSLEERAVSGKVLTLIKDRGLFFDRSSGVKLRSVTLTRQGFMIVYDSEELGYVINLPDAIKVKTSTMVTTTASSLKRTYIKIRLAYGSITLIIIGEEAQGWVKAILKLLSGQEVIFGVDHTTDITEITRTKTKDTLLVDAPCGLFMDALDPLPSSDRIATQSDNHNKPETTITTLNPLSVRQGEKSVATLRQILEVKVANISPMIKKIVVKEKKKPEPKISRHIMCKSYSAPVILGIRKNLVN